MGKRDFVGRVNRSSRNALKWIGGTLRGVFSTNFWIYVIVIGNIVFFAASILQPVGSFVDDALSFRGSSEEFMDSIEAMEERTGVPMERWVETANRNFVTLNQSVLATAARTERIEKALLEPRIYSWNYQLPDSEPDCLGEMESIFRDNGASSLGSSSRARHAAFGDAAGFVQKFSAMCIGGHVAIFGTGYNSEGTNEVLSDLISAVREKWPENSQVVDEGSD